MGFQKAELQWLKDLAKESIRLKLESKESNPSPSPYNTLNKDGASFVTLTIGGNLRGCIGNISPFQPLYKDVIENAKNAAFRDPRFPQLTLDEFKKCEIEISVMGEFKNHSYTDFNDLCTFLQKDKPGVLIKKGMKKALFLPQVWEQLPSSKDFISHLTQKAGLTMDAWDSIDVKVEIFEVIKY